MENNQPKGIGFYNIKTGETRYAQLEPQIQAYLNSSDMGINASRDQDFGWRLEKEWVLRVRAFRKNETKMELIASRNGGQKVTTVQILYAIYGEQLRAAAERAEENENPFEEEYLESISSKADEATPEPVVENIADEDDLDAAAEQATSDTQPEAIKPTKSNKKVQ